jgi:hypothetical protein
MTLYEFPVPVKCGLVFVCMYVLSVCMYVRAFALKAEN